MAVGYDVCMMVMVAGEIYSNMEEVMVMVEEGSCSNKKVGEEICNSMLVVVEVVTYSSKEGVGAVRVKGVGESCNNMVCDKE